MGEIAEMMLDGTMDCETGEWNFDGADGPGWPMTGAEAAAHRRAMRQPTPRGRAALGAPAFKVTKKLRAKIEVFGELLNHDPYHWQLRKDRKVVADWWPHKRQYRLAGEGMVKGADPEAFLSALARASQGAES